MATPVVVITLGIGVIFHATFAFPFASNYGEEGSVEQGFSRNCCDSVEYWLRNSASSKSELPSFEELTPNRERIPGNTKEMLKTRKKCKLLLKNPGSIKTKNMLDSYKEVGLSKDDSNCLSFWMVCNGIVMCVGSTDFIQSTNRKLLMVAADDQDEENNIQSYSFVLTGFLLCAMVVLVALCGSSVKNRSTSEIYTGQEGEVEVLSSVKVKSIREKDNSLSEVAVKQEKENEVVNKDKQDADVEIDRNSNMSPTTPTISATDPGLDVVAIDDKNVNKNDSAACSKNLSKEDKRKVSKKDKAMGSERSRTNPNPEAEVKGFSKIKQSLRRHSNDTKPVKKEKKSRKGRKSESTSPPSSPTTPLDSIGFQSIGNDRMSFMGRELPERPTADDNYSEPFDSVVRIRVTSEDLEEEEKYERVINTTTTTVPVSAKDEIRRSHQSSAEGTRWSIINDQGEEVLYDSVDEKQSVGTSKGSNNPSKVYHHSDAYESVKNEAITKEKKSNEAFVEELYEDVDKRNMLEIYDEPKTRKRSASDVSWTSSTYRECEQKTKSLERGKREVKPEPPPIEKISIAKMLHQASRVQEPIDWYTSTTKMGDFIVQDDRTTLPLQVSQHKPPSPTLSDEQLDIIYAKVDKEKQKRDRLESQAERDDGKEEDVGKEENVGKSGADTKTGDTSTSNGDVHEDENDYEIIATLPRKSVPAKEGEEDRVVNIAYV